MSDIWNSVKNTVKSVGNAVAAPAGVVWDLSNMPFDDKSDDFGSFIHAITSRAGNVLDPVLNPQTLTGSAINKTFQAMNFAWQEGVSEPVATANMVNRHAFGGFGNLGPLGWIGATVTGNADWGALVDGKSWSAAYDRANQQPNALGAAFAFGALHPNSDPLASKNPYQQIQQEHGALASGLAWGGEFAGMIVGDPTAAGLKGVGALRSVRQFAKLNEADRANLLTRITSPSKSGALKPNLAARTDKYLDVIDGTKNSLGRPLNGPEILAFTPELRKYAAEPHVIAGLLADANKIAVPTARRDAQRRILAVAAGDVTQIDRLRSEITEGASLADQLTNMVNEGVIDLKALAQNPTLRNDPAFIQRLDEQWKNLNDAGDVDRFVDDWNGRLAQLLGTSDTMPNLPGVHTAGKRALNRENEVGKLRAPANAHKKVDAWAAEQALKAQSASSVFQKGLYTLPVVVVKTAGLAASPYTKLPVAASDALRQTHFTGLVNLHDWGSATTQLDSMMRLAKVTPEERTSLLSDAFIAKTEVEKMRAINKAEETSLLALSRHYATKYGREEVDPDYIRTLLAEHVGRRNGSMTQLQGRAYSATQMPDALRARSAGRAEDAAKLEAGNAQTGLKNARLSVPTETVGDWSTRTAPKSNLRVDMIDDHGTPLSLPVLETQLSNTVPLLDMDIASTLLKRDNGYLARLSRAWRADQLELQRLADLKGKGATGLDRLIEAKSASLDWLVAAGQAGSKMWKQSVLFRLGYPMRVLMDDHMRISSQINAASFYMGNLREYAGNVKFNQFDRRVAAKATLRDAKVRRQEILDELDGDLMKAHLDRQSELRKLERSMKGHQRNIAGLRKQVEDAETKVSLGIQVDNIGALRTKLAEAEKTVADKEATAAYLREQLGDYGPDHLKEELASLEELIHGGWKPLAEGKVKIGDRDIVIGDGITIPGAFSGPYGSVVKAGTNSQNSFDSQLKGVEDRMYRTMAGGAHRTIAPTERGHLGAWADALNNQLRTSPVAMHFLEGGDVPSFVRWIGQPEQADLRRRVAHFAADPEDWGGRVQAMVWDYVPSDDLRQALLQGKVKAERLGRMFPNPTDRPAVHGRALADNIGSSHAVQVIGKQADRIYKVLGELPTDTLSRHPFFNSLYKLHAEDIYRVKRIGRAHGHFTPEDLEDIQTGARKMAMADLKRTLFDVSAHSHAAHMLRFISPFFAAHQEGVSRWWRIAADNPVVIRRYMQAFDVPRYLQIEVDKDGNLVEPGSPISREHRILLQVPAAFGGRDPKDKNFQSKWSINESAFNVALQGGLTNPGIGPVVAVPLEWAVENYADDTALARVARVFNPYPPTSPLDNIMPAVGKRLSAFTYGYTKEHLGHGIDPSLVGVGKREYNAAWSQQVQDMTVDFQKKYGREPNANEAAKILKDAGTEATTQMFHRVLWNLGSPAPATPQSKYASIQDGWYKISQQARAEGKDFDWAYEQFRAKYGDAYLPLIYSTSNNPAWVESTPAYVAALKHYRPLLDKVDPALTRAIVGAYAQDLTKQNAALGEYSPDARNWLSDQTMSPGSDNTYFSYDDPATAMKEQMARRGWAQYGELTASLTALAQQAGLSSYEDSPQLVAMKRAGVEAIKKGNFAFSEDYDTVDSGQYDRYLADLRDIASSPVLKNDPERTDIQTLQAYLYVRDQFSAAFDARKEAGYGGPDAAANADLRKAFTTFVYALVESNLDWEEYQFNGLIERDPLLLKQSEVVTQ